MKCRPIPFSEAMVRAILEGRKTQTRRIITKASALAYLAQYGLVPEGAASECPYGIPGDRLWVREAYRCRADQDDLAPRDIHPSGGLPWYCATGSGHGDEQPSGCAGGIGRKRPPMFMMRWMSRLTLEVTEVRVQRLQEISEDDAKAEGVHADLACPEGGVEPFGPLALMNFVRGWDSINSKRGPWASNPWVWAITFRRIA